MRRSLASLVPSLAAALAAIGCAAESRPNPSTPDAGSAGALAPAVACSDALDSVFAPTRVDGAVDPARRGEIARCAVEQRLDGPAFEAWARGLSGRPLDRPQIAGGMVTLRLTYRTTRAAASPVSALASAQVFLPAQARAKMPVVVVAHGSVGQGRACAPSLGPGAPRDTYYVPDSLVVAPLVAAGFAVIASDFAGYIDDGNGLPPSYVFAEDAAYSNLDAARALRKILGSVASDQVFLVGQSAGGHAALSALAYDDAYGSGGTLAGVVLYSPAWFSLGSLFTGALHAPEAFPFAKAPNVPNAAMLWYHYARAELSDGPGHGVDVFAPGKQAAVKAFFESACWSDQQPALEAMGASGKDIYAPEVLAAFADPQQCASAAPCAKWAARYAADRPHLAGHAATVPVRFLFGDADTLVPPPLMRCAVDRLTADGAHLDVHAVAGATHSGRGGVADAQGSAASDWIAAVAAGTPPAASAAFPGDAACPLPND
jgi:pimeloyl-ACP methyl ester carboxylesterase